MARFSYNPTDRQYWMLVAAEVPGKSADACYAKVCDRADVCLCNQAIHDAHSSNHPISRSWLLDAWARVSACAWRAVVQRIAQNGLTESCCLTSSDCVVQFYEQQPSGKADAARPRKCLTSAIRPPPAFLTQGGRKAGLAKVRQWARQVRFEQRHGGSGGLSDDDEDAAQALWKQVTRHSSQTLM